MSNTPHFLTPSEDERAEIAAKAKAETPEPVKPEPKPEPVTKTEAKVAATKTVEPVHPVPPGGLLTRIPVSTPIENVDLDGTVEVFERDGWRFRYTGEPKGEMEGPGYEDQGLAFNAATRVYPSAKVVIK